MKNTSSRTVDLCVAAGLAHPDSEAPDCRVTVCHNLRPSPDGAPELVPTGRPAPVAAGHYRPLAVTTSSRLALHLIRLRLLTPVRT